MARRLALALANIPYTPHDWNDAQAAMHRASTLEEAFHHASCLASGWYRRPVTIDYRITPTNDEEYRLRPSDALTVVDGWRACYEVKAMGD